MKDKVALLLTGTIKPNGMIFTAIQDLEVRRNHYIDSIQFWLKKTKIPIVFVENSNVNLSSYFSNEISNGKLEILAFQGNDFDRRLGKGFGELNCVEYACENSIFLKNSEFIFKVTGRYKVLNFQVFLETYMRNTEIDLLLDFKWRLSFVDSRFFGFTPAFIKDFLSTYREALNDSNGVYLEHVLAKAALNAIADGYTFEPLVSLPRIEGYSASSGIRYNSSYLHWLRFSYEYVLKYRSFNLGNLPWI